MYISVVIPVYNSARWIERCLQALSLQDYPKEKYEIILVDNGSTDGSLEIAKRYRDIKRLREPVLGSYAARNRGIAQAAGAVVAFTDSDCAPAVNWLAQIARAMGDPSVAVVLGRRSLPQASTGLALLESYENAKDAFVLTGRNKNLYYGFTNNMAVRIETLKEFGLFMHKIRGSDTIFVRNVVEKYSTIAVNYNADMVVTHLELDSIAEYYRKIFLYGRYRALNHEPINAQALSIRQRLRIFAAAIAGSGYSTREAMKLFNLLAAGNLAWSVGYWSAKALRDVRV